MKDLSTLRPILLIIAILCCSFRTDDAVFTIRGIARSAKYGFTEEQPIKVGGGASAGYHFQYLAHLRGPHGEALEIKRIGSCGTYPHPDTSLTKFDQGVLTCFSLECSAFRYPKVLYLDKYRTGDLYVPVGFTWSEQATTILK